MILKAPETAFSLVVVKIFLGETPKHPRKENIPSCLPHFVMLVRRPKAPPICVPPPVQRPLMEIPGNQPIFFLWPIQKLLHLGITNRAIPSIYGGKCPLYGCNAMGRLISWEIHYRPFLYPPLIPRSYTTCPANSHVQL